jgi:beta-barrel assembly-enhancing protease
MKKWGAFTITLALLVAALVASEKPRVSTPVGPDAVLSLIADSEQELTRLPVSFTRMSDADEIQVGDNLAREYLSQTQFSKELPSTQAVQIYLNKVGARVSVGASRKLPYQFHYVSDPDFVNAFALPGGHVFIGAGLMSLMDSEDELANVLGHEVEHIDHYHCAERVQMQAALQKLPLGELAAVPVEVFEAGYNKSQELEADREGTRLAVKAHYSPLGAVRMFQTFDLLMGKSDGRAQSPEEELSDLAMQTLEGYFRSHPEPSERIAQIKQLISDQHWEGLTNEQPSSVEYVYLAERAARALAHGKYAAAESAAFRSLTLQPGQLDTLVILTQAQFGLMEFPAALANYQQLLKDSPPGAASVAEFDNQLAHRALGDEHFSEAAKYASASLDLQPGNAAAFTVLANARMAMGDYPSATSAYETLLRQYPSDADNVVSYTVQAAEKSLSLHRYQEAHDRAEFCLTVRPDLWRVLQVEAEADLALADFGAAAKALRNLLDLIPRNLVVNTVVNMELVWRYADALSASNLGPNGVEDFHSFMLNERPGPNMKIENEIKIEYAGLSLMAGDQALAQDLVDLPVGVRGSLISPELMGRLGWWFYRAGKYADAEALLQRLARERPGDLSLRNDLSWVELEQNELDAASQGFNYAVSGAALEAAQWNLPQMGQAIVLWRKHDADKAMKNYEAAIIAEPRWTNPILVKAYYSPGVAETVAEMNSENAKRVEALKRQGRNPAIQ